MTMSADLDSLQERLGHVFKDRRWLQQALTHRSFSAEHNERLEFLGDSVLNLCVADWLYGQLQSQDEGDLSRIRANLVKQDALHGIAQKLGIAAHLRLGEGEVRSGGRQRPSILADALEALIGAVYRDAGYEAAQRMVGRFFAGVSISPGTQASAKDAKTALQEWMQARKRPLPKYTVQRTEGAAHEQVFVVGCTVQGLTTESIGRGSSRRAAEQAAALAALQHLQDPPQ